MPYSGKFFKLQNFVGVKLKFLPEEELNYVNLHIAYRFAI